LSRDAGDAVAFNDVIGPLVRVVEESVAAPGGDLRFEVVGDAGTLPGDVVTPLAVVINELMQNAVDHAFQGSGAGRVTIHLERRGAELAVDVVDDGAGLPEGFSVEHSSGLGLSIVHALVTGELGGSIRFDDVGGTRVHLEIPLVRQRPPA
jgi:two-component sensor histidine kinase